MKKKVISFLVLVPMMLGAMENPSCSSRAQGSDQRHEASVLVPPICCLTQQEVQTLEDDINKTNDYELYTRAQLLEHVKTIRDKDCLYYKLHNDLEAKQISPVRTVDKKLFLMPVQLGEELLIFKHMRDCCDDFEPELISLSLSLNDLRQMRNACAQGLHTLWQEDDSFKTKIITLLRLKTTLDYLCASDLLESVNEKLFELIFNNYPFKKVKAIQDEEHCLVSTLHGHDLISIKKLKKIIQDLDKNSLIDWSPFIYMVPVAYDTQKSYLAVGLSEGILLIWDVKNKKRTHVINAHAECIYSLAFTADDKYIISASDDARVVLCDVKEGTCKHSFSGHKSSVNCVAVSPDNEHIASGSIDGEVKIWNIQTKCCEDTLSQVHSTIKSMAYTYDGQFLIYASACGITIYDVKQRKKHLILEGGQRAIKYLLACPSAPYMLSVSEHNQIKIWDIRSRKCLQVVQGDIEHCNVIQFEDNETITIIGTSQDLTLSSKEYVEMNQRQKLFDFLDDFYRNKELYGEDPVSFELIDEEIRALIARCSLEFRNFISTYRAETLEQSTSS